MTNKNLTTILFFIITIFLTTFSALAQTVQTNTSWLEKPMISWNKVGSNAPTLPRPSAMTIDAEMAKRCLEIVRQPANTSEEAVARLGWKIYGASQRYGTTQVFTALSDFDGMCRPLKYNAFVFWEGKFAGTLSPVAMDSRMDGSLVNFILNSTDSISAEFARYSKSDALCCPSRTSSVFYKLKRDDIPDLIPMDINTTADTNSLYGKRWVLTKIGNQKVNSDRPFIEFNKGENRTYGDAGCNLFSGGLEVDGMNLKISNVAATKRMCAEEDANRLEMKFFQSLNEVTKFEIKGKTLQLYVANKPYMEFRASAERSADKIANVSGEVSYLPRIALSPNAIVKVKLLDVSKADAKSETIAEQTINAEGRQVPFAFELKYDPNKLNERNRYAVRAEIYENGKLRFTSTKTYSVITNGNPRMVDIIVDLVK